MHEADPYGNKWWRAVGSSSILWITNACYLIIREYILFHVVIVF